MTDPRISLFLSFFVKKSIIYLILKKRSGCNGKLVLGKINTKMPTRTKSVEMSKIVSNSEIHLHHWLCESSGFKIGRSNHRRCSIKRYSLKFCGLDRKAPVSESDTGFLLSVFKNTFLRNSSGRLLLIKWLDGQKFKFCVTNFF